MEQKKSKKVIIKWKKNEKRGVIKVEKGIMEGVLLYSAIDQNRVSGMVKQGRIWRRPEKAMFCFRWKRSFWYGETRVNLEEA
jgi:hypothetical protein